MLFVIATIFVVDTAVNYPIEKTAPGSDQAFDYADIFFYIDSFVFFLLTLLLVVLTLVISHKVHKAQVGTSNKDRWLHIFLISTFALGFFIYSIYEFSQFFYGEYTDCQYLYNDYRNFLLIMPLLDYFPI